MRKIVYIVAIAGGFGLHSCSVGVFTGGNQRVMIRSNVQADVYIGGEKLAVQTNEWVKLNKQYLGLPITITKEGCGERTVTPEVKLSPLVIVDALTIAACVGIAGVAGVYGDMGLTAMASAWGAASVAISAGRSRAWRKIDKEVIINLDCDAK